MKTLALVFALATVAYSQQDSALSDRTLERMKDRLGLTDEQVSKIKEISAQGKENEDKARTEREDKIKALLNDEQKKQYEEGRRNGFRGGGGGGGGQGGGGNFGAGWADRFMAPAIDTLKKDVGLTDEQGEKVKGHLDEFNKDVQARLDEYREKGYQGIDWQAELAKGQERVKDLSEKVKTHLTDEQKPKFDKLIDDRFNTNRPGGAGGAGGGTPTPPRGGRRERASVDDRVKRVMEALKIETAEDAATLRELVKKVVEAQYAIEDYEGDMRKGIEDLSKKTDATEDDIKSKIEELRGPRRDKDKALRDAQKSLAEVVTYRQELELIKQGILR